MNAVINADNYPFHVEDLFLGPILVSISQVIQCLQKSENYICSLLWEGIICKQDFIFRDVNILISRRKQNFHVISSLQMKGMVKMKY